MEHDVRKWLLDSDPAIRWQVMRDLDHQPDEITAAERSRVCDFGWGHHLLTSQSQDGYWGGSNERRNWLQTVYTLVLLRDLGIDPLSKPVRNAIDLLKQHVTWWQLDGRPFFDGETEPCVNGMILAAGSYFGEPSEVLASRLLGEQLEDGGWNCSAPPSTRGSFHTTICVLEGLLAFEQAHGKHSEVATARHRGEEYLLERGMFRSLSSGAVIDQSWLRYAFPVTWHYDVLRGLDYLRNAGVKPDHRTKDAVGMLSGRRQSNGRWKLDATHPDQLAVEFDASAGGDSRWVTLRALRVLEWAENGSGSHAIAS